MHFDQRTLQVIGYQFKYSHTVCCDLMPSSCSVNNRDISHSNLLCMHLQWGSDWFKLSRSHRKYKVENRLFPPSEKQKEANCSSLSLTSVSVSDLQVLLAKKKKKKKKFHHLLEPLEFIYRNEVRAR